jgi:hypothetical protein
MVNKRVGDQALLTVKVGSREKWKEKASCADMRCF